MDEPNKANQCQTAKMYNPDKNLYFSSEKKNPSHFLMPDLGLANGMFNFFFLCPILWILIDIELFFGVVEFR